MADFSEYATTADLVNAASCEIRWDHVYDSEMVGRYDGKALTCMENANGTWTVFFVGTAVGKVPVQWTNDGIIELIEEHRQQVRIRAAKDVVLAGRHPAWGQF